MDVDELCQREFERIVTVRDAAAGLTGFIVIHNTALGPAFGGIRRWDYPSPSAALEDALRLAASMTMKCAISDVAGGGGKAVIIDAPDLDRAAAYRAVGRCTAELGGTYYTGPDVGTGAADLALVAEQTDRVAVPSAACGDLAIPTALGVFAGIEAVARELDFDSLAGVHVAVQGLGAVGRRLCGHLAAAGARVTVADVRRNAAEEVAAQCDGAVVDPERIIETECDVFAPCALGAIIDRAALGRLRCRAIAGSANNVLEAAEFGIDLFRRGIVYAPDFVISSGALIHGALFHLEGQSPPESRVLSIGDRLTEIFAESRNRAAPPEVIAMQLAEAKVAAGDRGIDRDR